MDRTFLGVVMWTCRLIPSLALLCLVSACKNPDYCKGNPNDDCRLMWDAGPRACTKDLDCIAPMAVCDLGASMTCVQCTSSEPGACTAATPACVNNACQKCTAHAQCPMSNVCLPDGSCADSAQVAYVASGGSGIACTQTNPCGTLDDGVKAGRPYVKIAAGTVADSKTTTIDGKAVTILADPGAKLSRANGGVILQIQNDGTDVKIFDLEITGGIGPTNSAISIPNGGAPRLTLTHVTVDGNPGIGISAAAGTLTMSRSIVSQNIGGGISISGAQFDITNCFIFENGGISSGIGGMDISQILTSTGIHRLDFNTITSNGANINIPVNTGVNCSTIGTPLIFGSNIIYGNAVDGGGQQLGGSSMCSATYSDVGPGPAPGATNINMAPMFLDAAHSNFHLMGNSPAKDAADPAATLAEDFDGDTRPQGPRRDMGADEVKP